MSQSTKPAPVDYLALGGGLVAVGYRLAMQAEDWPAAAAVAAGASNGVHCPGCAAVRAALAALAEADGKQPMDACARELLHA